MGSKLWLVLAMVWLVACQSRQDGAPNDANAPANAAPGLDLGAIPPPQSGAIAGRIELSEQLKGDVAAGDVIYLIARHAATSRTIAVAKLAAPEAFPMPFQLTGTDVMMAGDSLAGKLKLVARVDKDGDPLTRNPGDVIGEVADLVEVPAKDVVLTLSEVMP